VETHGGEREGTGENQSSIITISDKKKIHVRLSLSINNGTYY